MTDRGLRTLGSLSTLIALDLGGCSLVTDEGVRGLGSLSGLKYLRLYGCHNVTDDMSELSAIPR